MAFCLTGEQVDKLIQGLRSGRVDPFKMAELSSEARRDFLTGIVGKENAIQVNSLFESKLLLKNQLKGYMAWVNKVAGLTPTVKRDLISKIERMDRILNPKEGEAFKKDLASTKLGVEVTQEEAKNIFDLSKKVQETVKLQKPDKTFETEAQRLAWGKAKVDLGNYVSELKGNNKFDIKSLTDIGGVTKSIRASMDNSAIFRQGWKTLWTNPVIWQRNARKSFSDIVRTFGNKKVMDEITADIISRPTYELMQKAKLAVSTIEEAFPSALPEKIPVLGRAYKASETAYTGFVYRQRADIFDKYIQVAQKSGVELTEKELKSIGSMVNSLTGRGNLGKFEPAANLVNNIFFSPRFVKSQVDTFLHPLTGAGGSEFVRKQAAINLLKVVSGTATILAVAQAVKPGSVEFDPRSADFGRIRVGDTRFDVTGGIGSLVTLASRLITQSTKSSTTSKITPLNSGEFGALTGKDVVYNYFENKLSPVASVIRDILKGEDFKGNKPSITGELENLFVPLSVSTYKELNEDPNSANTLLSMVAEGLGISTNTYGQLNKNWSNKPTKAQQTFLDKVGETKFKQANKDFNKAYDEWFSKTVMTNGYKDLSDDGKQNLINDKKDQLQNKVFSQYGFKYTEKKSPVNLEEKGVIKRLSQ